MEKKKVKQSSKPSRNDDVYASIPGYTIKSSPFPFKSTVMSTFNKERRFELVMGLLDQLKDFAFSDPMAFSVERFLCSKHLARGTFEDWLNDFPEAKEEYKMIKQAIGCRREDLAAMHKFNTTVWSATAHHYHERSKEAEEFRAKLKLDNENKVGDITVLIDSVPHSPVVPERKKE